MSRIAVLNSENICLYIVNEFDENTQSIDDYGGNVVTIDEETSLIDIYGKIFDGECFLNKRVDALTDSEIMLMESQAEIYEEQQVNALVLMESLAEIYETILGGE